MPLISHRKVTLLAGGESDLVCLSGLFERHAGLSDREGLNMTTNTPNIKSQDI